MTRALPEQAQLWTDEDDGSAANELLKPTKTIRIAAAGDVLLTALEMDLLDTPDFQRLRRVRQLGTATFVYPTSLHTRFDHALGTLAMAARMLDSIRTNRHNVEDERTITPKQEVLVRLYALLHDVPHVPYGHTLEDELQILTRHDENQDRLERFFGPDSQIGSIIRKSLGDAALESFRQVYSWDKQSSLRGNEFIHDIVSNTVCADLLDYLARDNLFCNLGVPLEYRFLNFLYLHRHGNQKRVFIRLAKHGTGVPRRDTLTDLCRLLETRYLIAERVYFHHAKIAGSAMVGRAVYESITAGELDESQLYDHTDDSLLQHLSASDATVAKSLGRGLWERRLHKQLHKYQMGEFDGTQDQDHGRSVLREATDMLGHPKSRSEFEDRVADEVGAKKGDVLIYCPPEKMNLKVARMNVQWKGKEIEFGKIDDPIIGPRLTEIIDAHQRLWGVWVFVSPALTDEQRNLVRKACDLQLVTASDQLDTKRREYYRNLVDNTLQRQERKIEAGTTKAYHTQREQVVDDMMATARDARTFKRRLQASVRQHFGSE
ncbi:MAG: HD domain-containing protein [Acidobacteria bacterium]|nr:HD domain-containing protein [Acidobacteriota bacterium]